MCYLRKIVLSGLVILQLNIINLSNLAIAEGEQATTTVPEATPFTPSEFQQNGSKLFTLQTSINKFLKDKEIIDLNYGLYAVNYINKEQETILTNPYQQIIKDFARIACLSTYGSKIPECNASNTKEDPKTYSLLRPSNIFNIDPQGTSEDEEALAIFAVKTMIDPIPNTQLNELLKNGKLDDIDNQKELANLIVAQAPITLAKNSLNEIIAKRKVFPESSSTSMMKMFKDEVMRRMQQEWIEGIKDWPIKNLTLELLQIEAFKLWIEYNKFLQNERIEALLATFLSSQNTTSQKMITTLEKTMSEAKKASDSSKAAINEANENSNGDPSNNVNQVNSSMINETVNSSE